MWEIIDRSTGIIGSLVLTGLALRFLAKAGWKKIGIILLAMGLFWLGGEMIKLGVAAPRPCWNPMTPSTVSCPESFSFPSGHALSGAMVAVVTGLAVRKKWVWIIGGIWVIGVMGMRILTGVHTWVDVLGGLVLGVVFGFSTWRWYYK